MGLDQGTNEQWTKNPGWFGLYIRMKSYPGFLLQFRWWFETFWIIFTLGKWSISTFSLEVSTTILYRLVYTSPFFVNKGLWWQHLLLTRSSFVCRRPLRRFANVETTGLQNHALGGTKTHRDTDLEFDGPIGGFVSDVCVLSWGFYIYIHIYIYINIWAKGQKVHSGILSYEVLVGLGWGGCSSEPCYNPKNLDTPQGPRGGLMVAKSHPQNRNTGQIPFLGYIWILRVNKQGIVKWKRWNLMQHCMVILLGISTTKRAQRPVIRRVITPFIGVITSVAHK